MSKTPTPDASTLTPETLVDETSVEESTDVKPGKLDQRLTRTDTVTSTTNPIIKNN